jgi:hypothetical protein
VAQRPFLLWSKGKDAYFDLAYCEAAGTVLQRAVVVRGAAFTDYDRDANLKLLIMTKYGSCAILRYYPTPRKVAPRIIRRRDFGHRQPRSSQRLMDQ